MSTASLIALSAQARLWVDCICSAISCRRFWNSGSLKKPKPSMTQRLVLAALVEEEVRHHRARDAARELAGELRVAGPGGEIVERDDAGQPPAVDHHQPPDRVADHQLACLLDLHRSGSGDHRRGGVVGDVVAEAAPVGDYRQ